MKTPFADTKASKAFMNEATLLLIREHHRRRLQYMGPSNFQLFYHGRFMSFQQERKEGYATQTGELKLQQTKLTISTDRIVANDVSVLPDFILGIGEQMESAMVASMVAEVSAVAEQNGNTIAVAKDESMADVYLEMCKRITGSINADGSYSPPQILNPEAQARFDRDIAEKDEDFHRQLEEVQREQEAKARLTEQERLQKYEVDG
jgi:hypothetical protein